MMVTPSSVQSGWVQLSWITALRFCTSAYAVFVLSALEKSMIVMLSSPSPNQHHPSASPLYVSAQRHKSRGVVSTHRGSS